MMIISLDLFRREQSMHLKDHILIAKKIISKNEINIKKIFGKVFILGCIQPDINYFTYLKGSIKYKFLHGHNYENSLKLIEKKIKKICRKNRLTLIDYYNMGKVVHYIADDFTYPHNKRFMQDIREHCKYEEDLNRSFGKYINIKSENYEIEFIRKENIFNFLINMHEEYLNIKPGIQVDSYYIYKGCFSFVSAVFEQGYVYGNIAA